MKQRNKQIKRKKDDEKQHKLRKGKKGVDAKLASGEDEEDGEGASDIP